MFAGAGGANNLVQSNWIREKGFGMGALHPADRVAAHRRARAGADDRLDDAPGRGEHQALQGLVQGRQQGAARLLLGASAWPRSSSSRVLAYSTVYGKNISEEADFDFIKGEGEVLKDVVAPWFGTFFWIFGSISLVLVALGVVDYVARLSADVLKTLHLRDNERWSESKIYTAIVWTMCLRRLRACCCRASTSRSCCSCSRACLNGIVMFIYSILLIKLNRQGLPPAIRVRGFRLGVLCFAVLFYGFFAGWYVIVQLGEIF